MLLAPGQRFPSTGELASNELEVNDDLLNCHQRKRPPNPS